MNSKSNSKPSRGRGRVRGRGRGHPGASVRPGASARPGAKPDPAPTVSQPPSLTPKAQQQSSPKNTPNPPVQTKQPPSLKSKVEQQSSSANTPDPLVQTKRLPRPTDKTEKTARSMPPQKQSPSVQSPPMPSLALAESTTPSPKGPPQKKPCSVPTQTPSRTVPLATHQVPVTVASKHIPPQMSTTITSSQGGLGSGPIDHGKKQPPNRPGFGKEGRQIMVKANFFPVRLPSNLSIHQYDMSILPPSKYPKWMCRKIFQSMEEQYSTSVFKEQKCAFDGSKNIYCHKKLTLGDEKQQLPVKLQIEGEKTERTFTVCLKYINGMHIDTRQMETILNDAAQRMPLIQALDIIMRHLPSLRMEPIGRSFFSRPDRPYNLGQGLEVWPGYYQSLRPTMGWKFKLNLDTSSTAFYTEQPVIDFMCTLLRRGRDTTRDLTDEDRQTVTRQELRDYDRKCLDKEIKGLKIEVTHLSYPRKYKVLSVTHGSAEKQTFTLDDGTKCSVADYFKKNYRALQHPHLPCLHVGQKTKNVYIPLEFCKIVAGQRCTRKLNETQTANMIRAITKPADVRQREINDKFQSSGIAHDPVLKDFGISVDKNMVTVPARVLDPPPLQYEETVTPRHDKGAWEVRGRFHQGATVNDYTVLVLVKYIKQAEVDKFTSLLEKAGKEKGMTFNGRKNVRFHDPYARRASSIESIFTKLKQDQVNLIIAIIDKGNLYSEIKRIGDTTAAGIATQCVLANTVQRKCNPATLGNICLKINSKLGGINNIISPRSRPLIFKKNRVIVFGADVTHPKAGDTSTPSIAAVVASIDFTASKFKGKHHVQKHRQEIIANLKGMTKELLIDFRQETQAKPSCIVFYRDGVSEGQFDEVRINEIAAIQQACTELEHGYEPKITFIVCQKRHHTRLFPTDRRDAGKGNNVPPGTIVEKEITHPTEFDFYLCSHAAIQGTSRPCHYHVLWDDNDFSADDLQTLTYQLCHTFWRCNRSVSYPAPAYYAHRAAAHARVLFQANEDKWSSDGSSVASGVSGVGMDEMDEAITIHVDRRGDMYFL